MCNWCVYVWSWAQHTHREGVCVRTKWRTYLYIYVYIYVCICVYIHIYLYVYAYIYTNMYKYIWIYTLTCIYKHIYVCIYTNMCIYVYASVYMYIHIYICVYTYIHLYIHIYICVYTYIFQSQTVEYLSHMLIVWTLVKWNQLLKICIFVISETGTQNYYDSARTGWLSVSIMWRSRITGHGAGSLVSKWDITIKSPPMHTVTTKYLCWYDLRYLWVGGQICPIIYSWCCPLKTDAPPPPVDVSSGGGGVWRAILGVN